MMHWSQLRTLIQRGMDVPVTATLTLHGDFDGSQFGWVMGGERVATVVLATGEYRVFRDGRKLLVTEADSQHDVPRLLIDGKRAVVMTDGDPLDAASSPNVVSSATWMVDRELLARSLASTLPAGPVTDVTHEGRPAHRVPALATRFPDGSEVPRALTVDADTGVLLSVEIGDGGGHLSELQFPSALPAGTFTWDEGRYGTPRRPEPVGRQHRTLTESDEVQEATPLNRDSLATEVVQWEAAASDPLPESHRGLEVVVVLDEDGGIERGGTCDLRLHFSEDGDSDRLMTHERPRWAGVEPHTVTAWAEPLVDAAPVDQSDQGRGYRWQTVLRGDGWSAQWDANRPVKGYVQVTGVLYTDPYDRVRVPPTRGRVHRIELGYTVEHHPPAEGTDATRGRFESAGGRDRFWWNDGPWVANEQFLQVTLDLDAAEPPQVGPVPSGCAPQAVREFVITGDGGARVLWRPDPDGLPAVWRTDLATGESRRVLLPLVVRQRFSLTGGGALLVRAGDEEFRIEDADHGDVVVRSPGKVARPPAAPAEVDQWQTCADPDGGWIVFGQNWVDGEAWPVRPRLGRVDGDGTLRWLVDPADSVYELWIFDGRVVTGWGDVLTLRDADLEVIRRIRMPWHARNTVQVGPWLGGEIRGPAARNADGSPRRTWQFIDPFTGEVQLSVPVAGYEVHVSWCGEELWIADGRLRVFTQDAAGEWSGREVGV